jgi:Polyphosphate kinase 2 (PPK2)
VQEGKRQKLPLAVVGKEIWEERLADIAHFEDYATRQGTKILKFFLHVSRNEQKKRFMARLDEPEKNWKFSASDVQERKFWSDYMHAFEEAIRAGSCGSARPAISRWKMTRARSQGLWPSFLPAADNARSRSSTGPPYAALVSSHAAMLAAASP